MCKRISLRELSLVEQQGHREPHGGQGRPGGSAAVLPAVHRPEEQGVRHHLRLPKQEHLPRRARVLPSLSGEIIWNQDAQNLLITCSEVHNSE